MEAQKGTRIWALVSGLLFVCALQAHAARPMVAAGVHHAVGLKSNGTVMASSVYEENDYGQTKVGGWTNIVQVDVGGYYTVGLKSDGTVVTAGSIDGLPDVSGWKGIVRVAAGYNHTVGLRSDGTVVTTGSNDGLSDASRWKDIVQVAAGDNFTAGLKSDGTVLTAGRCYSSQISVSGWKGIVQVSARTWGLVGLKSDGTVVATGDIDAGMLSAANGWKGIVQVSAGSDIVVGMKSDGTVVYLPGNANLHIDLRAWKGIAQVSAGSANVMGLKSNGTVVAAGDCDYGNSAAGWVLDARPLARIGTGNITHLACIPVILNGTASTDPDRTPLAYVWKLASRPSGSRGVLLYPRRAKALLVPDVPGVYKVRLVVNDGFMDSAPCTVSITVTGVKK